MSLEILEMKDASHREGDEMTDQHLRVRGPVDGVVTPGTLQAVRHRPRKQRHVQLAGDCSKQVVDAFLFDRIDRDNRVAGLNQRLEVVGGVGMRLRHGSSGCADSMNRWWSACTASFVRSRGNIHVILKEDVATIAGAMPLSSRRADPARTFA